MTAKWALLALLAPQIHLADGKPVHIGSNLFRGAFVHSTHARTLNSQPRHRERTSLLLSSQDATIGANNGNNPEEIARQLRQRAQDLRREAMAEEQSLKKAEELKKENANREADGWIDLLLGSKRESEDFGSAEVARSNINPSQSNIPTAQTLALRLKEHNLISTAKLMKIVERLHDRETSMLTGPESILSKPDTRDSSGSFILGDYENNSIDRKVDENQRITGLLDRILEAVQLIDQEGSRNILAPSLRIRVTELRQSREALLKRRVDSLVNGLASDRGVATRNSNSFEDLVRTSLQGDADSKEQSNKQRHEKMMKRLIETPPWLPPSLAAFAAASPVEVEVDTWKTIKSDVLANSDLVCTSWDATDVAAVFRVRITRNAVESDDKINNPMSKTFNNLVVKIEAHPELKQKVQLFLVDDYEWRPSFERSEETRPPPVIIAMAKEVIPEQESERGVGTKALATFSTLITLLTTLAYALSSFALNPGFFNAVVNENDVSLVPICLPIALGVLAVSALHEFGHYVAAQQYNVKMGRPIPLPSFQVGSFGCITPMRSFPSSRTAMFDVAMSGPGLAMLVSVFMIIAGLNLTVAATSFATFPLVPAAVLKSSFLIGSIATLIAPQSMLVPLSQPIPVHPLFMIGLAGLIMSAVNMLPIGRLDGGMYLLGRKILSLKRVLSTTVKQVELQ